MENILIPFNEKLEFTFKVNIDGTNNKPQQVNLVLEKDNKCLSFSACQKDNSELWCAQVENVGSTFSEGTVKLHINVLLNNKLFTPIKNKIAQIVSSDKQHIAIENIEIVKNNNLLKVIDNKQSNKAKIIEEKKLETKPEIKSIIKSVKPTFVSKTASNPLFSYKKTKLVTK